MVQDRPRHHQIKRHFRHRKKFQSEYRSISPRPCRDVAVSGCGLSTKCNAITLGTESLGDFERISVTGCRIRNTGMAGIALYCVDGAHLRDVASRSGKPARLTRTMLNLHWSASGLF